MATTPPARIYTLYRKLVLWVCLLLFGALLLVFSGDNRLQFIEPGPLTASHAGIEQCQACHVAAEQSPMTWLLTMNSKTGHEDSQLCLDCHQLGDQPRFAHSLAPEVLAAKTEQLRQGHANSTALVTAAQQLGWAPQAGEQLQCKSCHQEHSGNRQLISRNSADHCQSCHSQSFASFEDGHAEFTQYPFDRQTRIYFDHVSHIAKHFEEDELSAAAPGRCLSCHALDRSGNEIQTLDFEQSCASCHSKDISGSKRAGASGFHVLRVPGIDVGTLLERGVYIGEWPKGADESISPFMELLLQSDAHYATVRPVLKDVDLMDLRDANAQQLQAVATLAWCTKMLMNGIVLGGTSFLQQRLEESVGKTLSRSQLSALLATLPKAVIKSASDEWFPNLAEDLERHRNQQELWPETSNSESQLASTDSNQADDAELLDELDDAELWDSDEDLWGDADESEDQQQAAPVALSAEQWAMAGGWYRDGLTLYYRPAGHEDRFVRHWLDLSANEASASALFKQLSSKHAPGNCTSCHSIEQDESGQLQINWLAASSSRHNEGLGRDITRFRHSPHLNLQAESGCQTCHKLDPETDYAASFESIDPHQFESNFSNMQKSQCDSCHKATVENQNCLSCHRYHADQMSPIVKGDRL